MTDPVITTDRILLVALAADDEAEYLAAVAASRALHHPWVDPADTPERFAALRARAEAEEHHPLLIRRRDDLRLAGAVTVSSVIRGAFQSAFVGYWAFAGQEGRGYLTEGLRAVVQHAFTALGLHRLEANVQPTNTASIALAERAGFRYEGFSPHYLQVGGEWRDHNRYAVTREDWAPPAP